MNKLCIIYFLLKICEIFEMFVHYTFLFIGCIFFKQMDFTFALTQTYGITK